MFKSILKHHHRKLVLLSLVVLALVMPTPKAEVDTVGNDNAIADSAANTPVVNVKDSPAFDIGAGIKAGIDKVKKAFDKIKNDGKSVARSSGVSTLAATLAWSFGVIALVLTGSRMIFGGGDAAIEEFLMALLTMGVFAVMLQSGNYTKLVDALSGMMHDLATSILGTSTDPISEMGQVVKNIIDGFMKNLPGKWDALTNNVGYLIMSVIMGILAILAAIVALFFIMIYLNIGNVLMAIAFALGPVFIACGVWKVTRPFFEKWFNFLLIAGMYEVISSLLIALIAKTSLLPQSALASKFEGTAYVFSALFSMATLAFLATMIPEIVNALMPGQIGGMSSAGGAAAKFGKSKTGFGKWITGGDKEKGK